MKIIFLGTPDFVQTIKVKLAKHFTLVDSLAEADLGVIAAYGKILSQEELDAPKFGCINVHPSLLPKYRGASPIQEAILHGDQTTGVTIIKMDAEVDHGSIIHQEEMQVAKEDTFESLAKKLFGYSAEILPQLIADYLGGKITPREQVHTQASFCSRLTRESGEFDIGNPPDQATLDRMIRAYHPWPGVWCRWNDKIVKLHPRGVIQIEGKKAMPMKDFLNGYPDFPFNVLPIDIK